ncbi:MAG: ATP-binding protein [Spirochaetes bacterium]|nr:ATP-binding protein [Spirochaetota bacterium]
MIKLARNIKVGAKLKMIFGLLLMFAIVNTYFGYHRIMHIIRDYSYEIEYPSRRYSILYSAARQLDIIQRIVTTAALHIGEYDEQETAAGLREELAAVTELLRRSIADYKTSIQGDSRISPQEEALGMSRILAVEQSIEDYINMLNPGIFYLAQIQDREQAVDLVRRGGVLHAQLQSQLRAMYCDYSGRMGILAARINRGAIFARWVLLAIALLILITCIIAAVKTSKAIVLPIKDVATALDKVSAGDFDVILNPVENEDETNQLVRSTKRMAETLQNLIVDLERMSTDHDKGEIDTYVEAERYTGAYKSVVGKVNYMVSQHLAIQSEVVEVLTEMAHGNFEAELRPLPGKKAMLNVAVENTRKNGKGAVMARLVAEEANRSKSNFLAMMSHEIRTPLNTIVGIAQIYLQKNDLPAEYALALDKIYKSSDSLLRIINDILDMSKIEMGKLELVPVEYDAANMINDTVRLNIVRIGSKPIEFFLDVREDLPAKLCGDDLRVKQILNNLLSNAIKYTDSGHVKLSVCHSRQDCDILLHFTVSDTGQGMKDQDKANLFSAYSRFNAAANRSTEGTGLGMNITQNLVGMMDGSIEVESEYGKGSVFSVTLKQKAVKDSSDVGHGIGHGTGRSIGRETAEALNTFTFIGDSQEAKLQIARSLMPYGKVLVVDDTETNLYVAEGLLALYKLHIETATSGYEALEKVNGGKSYNIIFMDHMMPHMDGIEAVQKLRGLGYAGPVVALTANALAGNSEMFKRAGFDDFIPKPIDISALDTVLNKFIRDRHPEQSAGPEAFFPSGIDLSPKMLEVFKRDAEKTIATLRKTLADGDVKLFTISAHAIKSALKNIGEGEKSRAAYALEEAGVKGDLTFIAANTDSFVKSLEELIAKINALQAENDKAAPSDASEDEPENAAYLAEQLLKIQAACEDYDDSSAYAALDALKTMSWKKETAGALENIRDTLFLHSDFEEAGRLAAEVLNERGNET